MTPETLRRGPVAEAIRACRLIVVLRRIEPRERLLGLIDELADAGARAFEITFDSPSAAADIAAARDRLGQRGGDGGYLVGAGTVVDLAQLAAAQAAGADFAVAPLLDPALVRASVEAGLPFIPGVMTSTEMALAWTTGATFIKLFPASAVGPAFVREIRGPLSQLEIIPTGGVDGTNARAFLDAGAAAVGIGSALTKAEPEARRALVASLSAR